MGNWNISIQGTGPHGNDKHFDADRLARELMTMLEANGHSIQVATFTAGSMKEIGESRLCNPSELKRAYAAMEQARSRGKIRTAEDRDDDAFDREMS
jgi:hypothetical protein